MAYPPRPTPPTLAASIGGLAVQGHGGYLLATRIGGYGSSFPTYLIDVARWQLATSYSEQALGIGGMLGATSSRRTGYAYVWDAEVVVDLRQSAELALRPLTVEMLLRLGGSSWVPPRYYWIPRAHIDRATAMTDAGAKKVGRQRLSGVANCHVFLLPDQGSPDLPNTPAGAYKVWMG